MSVCLLFNFIITAAEIITMWRPGMQADSHELLMEILNSGAATAVNVNNLIQFDVITKGIILCLLICI